MFRLFNAEMRIKTWSVMPSNFIHSIKTMPRPRSLPIIGTTLDFLFAGGGNKLHEYIDSRHKELGPIFYEKLGSNKDLIFISDPSLMKTIFLNLEGKYPAHILPEPWVLYEKLHGSKRGLFFMDGEEWLQNRRIMNKYLLKEEADKWLEAPIKMAVEKFIQNWKILAKDGCHIPNLESEFYKLSTDVIIAILLGTNSQFVPTKYYAELLNHFSENVKKIFQTTTKLYGLPVHWCQHLNLKVWRNFEEAVNVSLLLAHKLTGEILNTTTGSNGLVGKLCQENLTHEIITRIVADFIIAAGDTTAYTLLWNLLLLTENNEIRTEICIQGRTQVKNVIKESMRLYPVAPFLTRILPRDSELGPYKLDKDAIVIASIYTSGRDEQNFSEAHKFLPYRWDRDDPRKKNLPNHVSSATLPFALGARSCIGKKIAMAQLTEVIYQIVNNFEFKCKTTSAVNAITSQVLVPDKPIQLLLSLKKCI